MRKQVTETADSSCIHGNVPISGREAVHQSQPETGLHSLDAQTAASNNLHSCSRATNDV